MGNSDYSFAQFRYLKRLLLVHGRWNYRRVSLLICYSFYKNVGFVTAQLIWQFYSQFSGTTLFESWNIGGFNTFFTAWPILIFAVFDQDVPQDLALLYPQLYKPGHKNEWLNLKYFTSWYVQGVVHATVSMALPFLVMDPVTISTAYERGQMNGLWLLSMAIYTVYLFVVNMKVVFMTNQHHFLSVFFQVGTFPVLWIFFSWIYQSMPAGGAGAANVYGTMARLWVMPVFYYVMFGTVAAIFVPELAWFWFRRFYNWFPYHIIQEKSRL